MLVVAALLTGLWATAADATQSPVVTVSPGEGGPGARVTAQGAAFCGKSQCSDVSLSLSGYQLAAVRPDGSGAFRVTFVMPGGLPSGQLYLTATQDFGDGNQAQAMTGFVYAPSRGEEAERKQAEQEALLRLVNPSRPTGHARGTPLASAAVAATRASQDRGRVAATKAAETGLVHRATRWWMAGLVVVLACLAVAGGLIARRVRGAQASTHRG